MEKKQSQIKINLSAGLKKLVKKRADKYGLTIAGFAKHLMIRDIEESEDLEPSKEMAKIMKDVEQGKVKFVKVDNTDDFFDKL